jgi:hypothetical protein
MNDVDWLWPALATSIFVMAALAKSPPQSSDDFGFSHIVSALYMAIAVAASLAAWLIWSLI